MTTHVFLHKPHNFHPRIEAAGCFCEYEGRLLLLKRHPDKVEGLKWGVPGGKLEAGEQPIDAARRELFEETGIKADHLQAIGKLYVRRSEVDFTFHLFFFHLTEFPLLKVAVEEHVESAWVHLQEAKQLPLISGGQEALEYFYLWRNDQKIMA